MVGLFESEKSAEWFAVSSLSWILWEGHPRTQEMPCLRVVLLLKPADPRRLYVCCERPWFRAQIP